MKEQHNLLLPILMLAPLGCLFALILAVGLVGVAKYTTIIKPKPAVVVRSTSRPTFTATAMPPTITPLPTATPTVPATPTPTPIPPTATAVPATVTPAPSPTPSPPPTSAPAVPASAPIPPTATATPAPAFAFAVLESAQFETSHADFDVFVAVTDPNNTPLAGYKVVAEHSAGLRVESALTAGAWTENSGAKHYKGGNLKLSVLNSPTGVWRLQLVDENGNAVAPALEFAFDAANPHWYFMLYRRAN